MEPIVIEYDGKIIGNNQRYQYRSNKKLSPEYTYFKNRFGWYAKIARQTLEVDREGEYFIKIRFSSRHDVDNITKGILDSLQGIIYENDNQVAGLSSWKDKRLKNCKCKLVVKVIKL